jgi:hypothetical protein
MALFPPVDLSAHPLHHIGASYRAKVMRCRRHIVRESRSRTIAEGLEHSSGDLLLKTHHSLRCWFHSASPWVALSAIATISMSAVAPAATVSYSNPNCSSFSVSGTPPNQTVTCVAGGGGGVPVCVPSANPPSPAIGQSTTISANCSNGPSANGYVWTGGTCAGLTGSTCTVTKTRAMSITYSVSASNASGTGSAAQITITWQ